ncbi:MAG: hypothetical protein KKB03_02970 [Nanoarchaeota archaeon]|nr:hypothetical protein [Nanoarchaeota archaeon]MBU2520177.1 hypothetical protein [Nanoarchaeota archaeon]
MKLSLKPNESTKQIPYENGFVVDENERYTGKYLIVGNDLKIYHYRRSSENDLLDAFPEAGLGNPRDDSEFED